MRSDPRERVEFITARRDTDVIVKFRIRNRSQFEVWMVDPTIEFRGQRYRSHQSSRKFVLHPGQEDIIESKITDCDIESADICEFKILDTGHANKV